MIFADKENLKTTVAQDILRVREKEMKFYTRNLSMLGTHAALLAGFAFTILSQHKFKVPQQGFLDYETEVALGMWPPESTFIDPDMARIQVGMWKWPWHVAFQQVFQLLHLCFTAMGILLHLWTVYTTVVTNILGLNLALGGPEGSVDRAVRHMAQQNQFALRKFIYGLVLFNCSLLFYTLSEYHLIVSFCLMIVVLVFARQTFVHIRELATSFYLGEEDMITGQWIGLDSEALKGRSHAAHMGPTANGGPHTPTSGTYPPRKGATPGNLSGMMTMVSGRYNLDGTRQKRKKPATAAERVKATLTTAAENLHLTAKGARGTRWAQAADGGAAGCTRTEEQAPSRVAERLILNQQTGSASHATPASRRLARSNSRRLRWQSSGSFRFSFREGSQTRNAVQEALEKARHEQRREQAATQLQARARGLGGRQRSRELLSERVSYMRGSELDATDRESIQATLDGGAGVGEGSPAGAVSDEPKDLGAVVGNLMDKLGLSGWDAPPNTPREAPGAASPAASPEVSFDMGGGATTAGSGSGSPRPPRVLDRVRYACD